MTVQVRNDDRNEGRGRAVRNERTSQQQLSGNHTAMFNVYRALCACQAGIACVLSHSTFATTQAVRDYYSLLYT